MKSNDLGRIAQKTSVTRRCALGVAAIGACSAVLASHTQAFAIDEGEEEPSSQPQLASGADENEQYGFLVNSSLCINCGKCVEACRLWSRTPDWAKSRRQIRSYEKRNGTEAHISCSCMHCDKPACAEVCPAGAISKTIGGIVVVDKQRCIGCKYCYQACPFEAPHYDSVAMDKCDYCFGAGVKLGEAPHCVAACKTGALQAGPLKELRELTSMAVEVGGPTEPSMLII